MWVLFVPSPRSYTTSNVELCGSVLSTLLVSVEAKYVPGSRFSTPGSLNMANFSSSYNGFAILPLGGVVSTTLTVRVDVTVVFPSVAVYTTLNEPTAVFCTWLRSVVNCEPVSTVAPSSEYTSNRSSVLPVIVSFVIVITGATVSCIVIVLVTSVLFTSSPRS